MKVIFEDMITKHVCVICEKFHPMAINKKKIKELTVFYRKSTEKITDDELEKVVACIYALQTRGIPLKASSKAFGIETSKTLTMFKKLGKPSFQYAPLFIELLKIGYTDEMKARFDKLFDSLAKKVPDHFMLATIINMELKKSNSYFGYSEVPVLRYRKMIRDELNG